MSEYSQNFDISKRRFLQGGASILAAGGLEVVSQQLWTPRSAEAKPTEQAVIDGMISFSGIPADVQDTLTVRRALEKWGHVYTNNTGLGTEAALAEPGVYLESDWTLEKEAWVKSFYPGDPKDWFLLYNRYRLTDDRERIRVGEKRQTRFALGGGVLNIDGNPGQHFMLRLAFDEVTHYNVFIDGLDSDSNSPKDRNRTADWTELAAGHGEAAEMAEGAFASENYYWGLVRYGWRGLGNDNGREGARRAYGIFLSLDDGRLVIIRHDSPNPPAVGLYRNFRV